MHIAANKKKKEPNTLRIRYFFLFKPLPYMYYFSNIWQSFYVVFLDLNFRCTPPLSQMS